MRLHFALVLAAALGLAACADQPFVTDVPFRVTSVSPSPGAVGIGRGAAVVVTFSEAIAAESVTSADAFKVELVGADGSATAVAGTYKYGESGGAPHAATFTPNRVGGAPGLPFAARVRISLATTITRQRDGGKLPTPVSFEFRTQEPPPLAVARLSPRDGAERFERTGQIRITFSEPVDCAAFPVTPEATARVTFLETRDGHPHWKSTNPAVPVPGQWICPVFPASDPRRFDGSCTASDDADGTDYCTVTFRHGAEDEADPATKLAKSLGLSSTFELTLPGADGSADLAKVVHSLRAIQGTSEAGIPTVFGALSRSVVVGGRVADPPALALVGSVPAGNEIVLRSAERAAALKLTFAEQIDCASLQAGVTLTETFDPKVLAARGGAATRPVTGHWSCEGLTPNREDFTCGADGSKCTYTFTPARPAGEVTPFAFSSKITVVIAGGAYSATTPRVESVRASSVAGQLPASSTITFHIADPEAFGVLGAAPSAGATGASRSTALTFTFSEPPDCALLATATKFEETLDLSRGGAKSAITGTWSCAPAPAEAPDQLGEIFRCNASGNCVATFTPSTLLGYSSKIDVTLAGGPFAAAGPPLVQSRRATAVRGILPQTLAYSFNVQDPPPLALVISGPANGAREVPHDTPITVVFSEPIDCASLRAFATVREKLDPTRVLGGPAERAVAGTWACVDRPAETGTNTATVFTCDGTALNCVATFTPTTALELSSEVTLTLPGSAVHPEPAVLSSRATSRGGRLVSPAVIRWFTEGSGPLALFSVSPGQGASSVSRSSDVVLSFDTASGGVRCSSIVPCTGANDATCTLRVVEVADPLIGGTAIGNESARLRTIRNGTLGCLDGAGNVTFALADFALSSDVEVTVKGGLHGFAVESTSATAAGGQLPADVAWSFSVEDPDGLLLTAVAPSANGVSIAANAPITATFSQPLACTTVNATSVLVEARSAALASGTIAGGFSTVAGARTCSGAVVTFTPTLPLAASATVRVTLGTTSLATTIRASGATTLDGFVKAPIDYTYRVADPAPLRVVSALPAAVNVSATTDVRVTFDRAVRCASTVGKITVVDTTAANAGVGGSAFCTDGTTTGPAVNGTVVIFTPSERLAVNHDFVATFAAGIEAVGATVVDTVTYGVLAAAFELPFTVVVEDLRVVATTPVGNAADVAPGATLKLRFNQDVALSSFVPCTGASTPVGCNVTLNPGVASNAALSIPFTLAYDNATFTLELDPSDPANVPDLKLNQAYFVQIKSGVTGPRGANGASQLAVDNGFTFRTAAQGLVRSTTPAAGDTDVAVTAPLCVEFAATVVPATLTAGGNQLTFTYTDAAGHVASAALDSSTPYLITSTNGLTDNEVCANVVPAPATSLNGPRRLLYAKTYAGRVGVAVNVGGAFLASPYTWTFTTASPPQFGQVLVKNAVINETLTANAIDVPVNGVFVVQFASAMDPATLTAANIKLSTTASKLAVAATITLDDATNPRAATITPDAVLSFNANYTIDLYGGVGGLTEKTGASLDADLSLGFKTSVATTVTFSPSEAQISPGLLIPVVATRALHLPSANSSTVVGKRLTTLLPGIVALHPLQPTAVTYIANPTWPTSVGAEFTVATLAGLLDLRGNPVTPAISAVKSTGVTAAVASLDPSPAVCVDGTTCAVSPSPGATNNGPTSADQSFVFTLPGAGLTERMLATSYTGSTATADGSISLEGTGVGFGTCPTAKLPIDVTFEPGNVSTADKVRIKVRGPTYMVTGCKYALKIRQYQTANLYNLAPETTLCNGINGTVPTYILSITKCATNSEGLVYTGESVAPTVDSVEVQRLSDLTFVAADTATGIYGATQVRITFSEAIDPATVATAVILGGATGTLTRTLVDNVLTVSGARFASGTAASITVGNYKDRAGNLQESGTTKAFTIETTVTAFAGVPLAYTQTASREAPFGRLTVAFNEPIEPTTLVGNNDVAPGSISVRIGTTRQIGSLYSDPTDLKKVYWAPLAALATGTSLVVDVNPAGKIGTLQDGSKTAVPTLQSTLSL